MTKREHERAIFEAFVKVLPEFAGQTIREWDQPSDEKEFPELKDTIPLRPLRQVKVTGHETPFLVYCPEILLEGEVEFALDAAAPDQQQHK